MAFPPTHWSAVYRAGASDQAARSSLEELCRAYWPPLVAYLRRRGVAEAQAEDWVQGFLTAFIDGRGLARADADKGRFRSYLLGALRKHVAADQARATALRRGGGIPPVAELDAVVDATVEADLEAEYDRRWAQTLVSRVLEDLSLEAERRDQRARHEALVVHLFDADPPSHQATAERLGLAEGAVKVAVHRLRRRFGELLRREVETTVADPADVDDEIRALLAALQPRDLFS